MQLRVRLMALVLALQFVVGTLPVSAVTLMAGDFGCAHHGAACRCPKACERKQKPKAPEPRDSAAEQAAVPACHREASADSAAISDSEPAPAADPDPSPCVLTGCGTEEAVFVADAPPPCVLPQGPVSVAGPEPGGRSVPLAGEGAPLDPSPPTSPPPKA